MTAPGSPNMPKYSIGEYALSTRFSDTVSQHDDATCSASIPLVSRLTIICTRASACSRSPESSASQMGSQCFLKENIANEILKTNAVAIIQQASPISGEICETPILNTDVMQSPIAENMMKTRRYDRNPTTVAFRDPRF